MSRDPPGESGGTQRVKCRCPRLAALLVGLQVLLHDLTLWSADDSLVFGTMFYRSIPRAVVIRRVWFPYIHLFVFITAPFAQGNEVAHRQGISAQTMLAAIHRQSVRFPRTYPIRN